MSDEDYPNGMDFIGKKNKSKCSHYQFLDDGSCVECGWKLGSKQREQINEKPIYQCPNCGSTNYYGCFIENIPHWRCKSCRHIWKEHKEQADE